MEVYFEILLLQGSIKAPSNQIKQVSETQPKFTGELTWRPLAVVFPIFYTYFESLYVKLANGLNWNIFWCKKSTCQEKRELHGLDAPTIRPSTKGNVFLTGSLHSGKLCFLRDFDIWLKLDLKLEYSSLNWEMIFLCKWIVYSVWIKLLLLHSSSYLLMSFPLSCFCNINNHHTAKEVIY